MPKPGLSRLQLDQQDRTSYLTIPGIISRYEVESAFVKATDVKPNQKIPNKYTKQSAHRVW